MSISSMEIVALQYRFSLQGTRSLWRSDGFQVQGRKWSKTRDILSHLMAQKLSKTTRVMSEGLRSPLEKGPTGQRLQENFEFIMIIAVD